MAYRSDKTRSPLDEFFLAYPKLGYCKSNPPQQEYRRLLKIYGWKRGDPEADQSWSDYRTALVHEFDRCYGTPTGDFNDPRPWQNLCRAIGIQQIPKTREDCQRVCSSDH
jgi:hypothetical protein